MRSIADGSIFNKMDNSQGLTPIKSPINDFDAPIEILDNYVALCPNCHRKIHLAVDRERLDMIRNLYNARIEKLTRHGLSIELKDLYKYYKIDE